MSLFISICDHTMSRPLCLCFYLCLCLCLSCCLSVYFLLSVCLCVCLSCSVCLSVCLSLSLSLSLNSSLCVCVTFSLVCYIVSIIFSSRKRWVLFPPNQSNGLYPTRVPYEESSVFSQVDLACPDLRSFPCFKVSAELKLKL